MIVTFVDGPMDGEEVEIGPTAFGLIDIYESTTGRHAMWRQPADYTGNSWQYVRYESIVTETRETINPDTLAVEFYEVETGREYLYRGVQYAKVESFIKAQTWTSVGPVRVWNGGSIDVPYVKNDQGATLANGWKIVWNQ